MSIFDRLVPKETGKQKSASSNPSRREVASLLDAAAKEAKEMYPEDSKTLDNFLKFLKAECRNRYKASLEGTLQPMKAAANIFLSNDRMVAYACLLKPENGGDGITLNEFLMDLHYEGINYGILQDVIEREFKYGYLHIFPVARGTAPQNGENGKVTELFKRRKNVRLEAQSGDEVDFSQDIQLQPIKKGTVICTIQQPKPGVDGMDVTGEVIPCEQVAQVNVPMGKNTVISKDGQELVSSVDGILYMEDDLFCVHGQKIIDDDLKQFQGLLEIKGNLYIGGDVDEGVNIRASGDIVINGKLGRGRVTSQGGTIRVQKGVYGVAGKTSLSAAGQVQAPVIEWADIDAGTSVIAESILNSTIHCNGTVYVMTGRGMIASSQIWAGDSVLSLRIGNQAGSPSQISVGYPPRLTELWEKVKEELAQVQATIDKLWKPIIDLRNKGSRILESEQAVLDQLLVQRELYTKRREELMAELRAVNKELDKKSRGRIRCEKIHPVLDVQIGRLTEKIITIEENCNIRAEENRILMK